MNDRLVTDAEKLLQELIEEAKRMDAWFKDEVKRKNYREMKERQLSVISEIIEKIAKSKVKDYKSLTNKSLFKFMDLIDM